MTSVAIRQLQYINNKIGFARTAEETGLDTVSLAFSLAGAADAPLESLSSIRAAYSRTAYQSLKDSGMSASQANRFRGYAPETVTNIELTMTDMVMKYSLGLLAQKTQDIQGPIKWEDMTALWEKCVDQVTFGLQNSQKTYEDWQNY